MSKTNISELDKHIFPQLWLDAGYVGVRVRAGDEHRQYLLENGWTPMVDFESKRANDMYMMKNDAFEERYKTL